MNGGPAFPRVPVQWGNGDTVWGQAGMTLRDYFAAQALPMLIAAYLDEAKQGRTPDNPTVVAYVMADAMLKARKAQP